MPFLGMTPKVRKDPMGPSTMGLLKNNGDFLRRLAAFEHIVTTGEHNAREIPRVVRRISGTTVSPSSTDITSVTSGGAGIYQLTLASGRFDSAFIACQINPCGSDVANKPYLAGYKVISSTSIEVYLKQLTPALGTDGAGNSWAPTDCDFDIAIHSEPLAVGSWPTALPANSVTGDPLKPTRWNALVKNAADVYTMMEVEHAAGEHNSRQIASISGLFRYDGSSFSLAAGVAPGISVSRTSAGIYAITSSSALASTTHAFPVQDWARDNSGDSTKLYRMHLRQNSTTSWTLYTYNYRRNNTMWVRDDADFWLALHTA